jgi:TPR repeat protein
MKKIKVLFFAADPSAVLPGGATAALQLGEDVRQISKRIEEDGRQSAVDFDWRLAARPDDIVSALRRTRPQVVHFSGHGNLRGLVFTSADGYGKRVVEGTALRRTFELFPNDIRLVVLSACFSKDQAASIADVVGCAVGTSGGIADEDAIRFDAAFYGYLACGESVKTAFDRASNELELNGVSGTSPELLSGRGVDPAKLILLTGVSRRKQGIAAATAVAITAIIALSAPKSTPTDPYVPPGLRSLGCGAESTLPSLALDDPPSTSEASPGPGTDLENAKALCEEGDAEGAFHLFEKAARAGNAEALGMEAIAYMTGRGAHHDPQLGVEKLRKAAGKGDVRSMTALATAYQTGYGVKLNQYYARLWLGKAARLGDAEAMRRLGVAYRQAKSDSALYWLPRAVEAGSADAQVDIGYMYDAGILVDRDTARAVQQYAAAARAGSARGMFALGAVYQAGMGVKRDPQQAHRWYRKAVCAGSAEAMNALGEQYLEGSGVPADSGMAERWFRLAYAGGSASAAGKLRALKAPERPRRWRGPVGWIMERLGLSETRLPVSCSAEAGPG